MTKFIPQRKNANKHTQRGLRELEKSIQRDGWIGGITTAADGETFDGSARLETVENVMDGVEPLVIESDGTRPIVIRRTDIPNADDPRAKRLALAANRIQQLDLDWDAAVLADIAQNEAELLEGLWQDDELAELLGQDAGKQETADAGELASKADELQAKWQVQAGDLWQIGKHRLLCGDSTNADDVVRLIGEQKARLVWTDPPYEGTLGGAGFAASPDIRNRVNKMQDSIKDLYSFDPTLSFEAIAAAAESPCSYFFFCNKNLVPDYINYAILTKRKFDLLLWHKPNFLPMGGAHYFPDTEYLIKVSDKGAPFVNGLGKDVNYGTYWVLESLKGQKREVGGFHPTIKPIKIPSDCILICSGVGDVVYDPFVGSGTTLVACEQTGRIGRGLEIEPKYCAVTLERLELLGLTPQRINTETVK